MIKNLILVAGISTSCFLHAQNTIKKYVKENTVQIDTINPGVSDFNDLKLIGDAIGDSRIVMLGEQDHGDAPSFLAKTRLIKYLHEEKGFNVIAFESDFWGINLGWDLLKKEESKIDTFLADNIFSIWTDCDACSELFYNYIPATHQTKSPITISGFDSQVFMTYSAKNMSKTMDSVFKSHQLSVISWPEYSTKFIPLIDSLTNWYGPYKDTSQYAISDRYLRQIKTDLGKKLDSNDFWMMSVENLIAINYEFRTYGIDKATTNISAQSRDQQMARNLQWLCEVKFPNEKIIVWAHSYHIAKYEKKNDTESTPMGGFFARNTPLNQQSYVIGFTSYSGTAGRLGNKEYTVGVPEKNSFENWLNPKWKYSFTDFKKYRNSNKKTQGIVMKGWGHFNSFEDWTNIYDGVFFIREMYPCKLIE